MAITQYYVDPAIAAPSGSGTIGDPYGDLQHALDTITRNATDGDQINIKAGTDEVLAATLDLTAYGSPTASAPLVLSGYSSSANDGGIGVISGGGSHSIINESSDPVWLVNLEMHNCGASLIARLGYSSGAVNCTFHNTSGNGLRTSYGPVLNCTFYNIGGVAAYISGGYVVGNYINNSGTNSMTTMAYLNYDSVFMYNLLASSKAGGNGIVIDEYFSLVMNNTIINLTGAGTGKGISAVDGTGTYIIANNYVEGFSGVGGGAISTSSDSVAITYINNLVYNNTTDFSISGDTVVESGNTALSASGLVDPANDDFRARVGLRAGAWPTTFPEIALGNFTDIGAVQRREWTRTPRLQGHGV